MFVKKFSVQRSTATIFNYILQWSVFKPKKFPWNAAETAQAKGKWSNRFKTPTVTGTPDCTHLR